MIIVIIIIMKSVRSIIMSFWQLSVLTFYTLTRKILMA